MKAGKTAGVMAVCGLIVLGGCSPAETRSCSYGNEDMTDTFEITASSDRITHMNETITLDFAAMGATNEDMMEISDEDLETLFVSAMPQLAEEMEGVSVEYEISGTKAVVHVSIDFAKADPKVLYDLGIIDAMESNVSMEQSVNQLKEKGYECK